MKLQEKAMTAENATLLVQRGCEAIRSGDASFDLSAVTEVDSAAVATLLAWQREARSAQLEMKLNNVPAALCSLASLYGVDELLKTPKSMTKN